MSKNALGATFEVVTTEPDGTLRTAVRAFGTMFPDILALAAWPAGPGVSHAAIENTGVT